VSWRTGVGREKARRGKRIAMSFRRFEFHGNENVAIAARLIAGATNPVRHHPLDSPSQIAADPQRPLSRSCRPSRHPETWWKPILERHFHPDSYACRIGKGAMPPPCACNT